ncbi:MAG: winged helix-turn-helix transcriptional regulator [Verrucomicrobiales bacterium]|nr:winged helix-turn-helix transcriptional regulator [Verrucomicrobiales bacterium]
MPVEAPPSPTSAADVFKALGHPARVAMVRRLGEGECCVCDLVETAGLGWSTVSRHLGVLREAGVVAYEKRGQQVWYRLTLPCVIRFLNCLEAPGDHPDWTKPVDSGCCS